MMFDPILDLFRGKAITIPPLDGAFRPNTALDDAPELSALTDADNLVVKDGVLLASSGNAVFALESGAAPRLVARFDAPVTALAVSPSGELFAGLETGVLLADGKPVELPAGISSITALAFAGDGALWLANGSATERPSGWKTDLMNKGAFGSVWLREAGSGSFRRVAGNLAFPYGLLATPSGILVSESWRHRVVTIDASSGRASTHLDHLPGYPARLSPTQDGGAWLSVFAPRNRLIEFVLGETDYRTDMMAEMPSEHWIAPALSSSRSFMEPLQCGAIRSMGVHKPWSPTRSYGLVVRLDARLQPVSSLHSRANGHRHGICSAIEHGGTLYAASRGSGSVLAVEEDAR